MPPKLKSIVQIKAELLEQKRAKLLREREKELPDFISAYFEETVGFEPVPLLIYQKTEIRTVQEDEDEYYEREEQKIQQFYNRMQKIDDQLYCKEENAKFREFLKAEIYEDKMKIERELKAELELEKQVRLMEEQLKEKKQEMLVELEEEKRLQKIAEQALMNEYNRKEQLVRQRREQELQQEREKAAILLKELKNESEAELAGIEHENQVERERMMTAMREGVFFEERQMREEMVETGREANEELIDQRIGKIVESAAKVEERKRKALLRKAELEESRGKLDEKTHQRAIRAVALVEERRNRASLLEQERMRIEALRELMGE